MVIYEPNQHTVVSLYQQPPVALEMDWRLIEIHHKPILDLRVIHRLLLMNPQPLRPPPPEEDAPPPPPPPPPPAPDGPPPPGPDGPGGGEGQEGYPYPIPRIRFIGPRAPREEHRQGGPAPNNTQEGEDDLELDVLEGLLDGVDEVDNIHATNDLASAVEDFLLDVVFSENVTALNCGPCGGPQLVYSSSKRYSPGFSGSRNGAAGVSESSMETAPGSEWKNASHKTVFCDSYATLMSKHGCQAQATKVRSLFKQKRLRESTRFMKEISDLKSGCLMEKIYTVVSKDKRLKVRSELFDTRASKDSFSESLSEWQLRKLRGYRKKRGSVSWLEFDNKSSASESEDDHVMVKNSKKDMDWRKHQRTWALSKELVDGNSQSGVGRLTERQRHLFSSSAYSAPIDLRVGKAVACHASFIDVRVAQCP